MTEQPPTRTVNPYGMLDLLRVLEVCISCTDRATQSLRIGPTDSRDRYATALLLTIRDYAVALVTLGSGNIVASAPIARSALDAYVDLVNICDHPDYCENLEAADATAWKKVLEAASRGTNSILRPITESEALKPGREHYSARLDILASRGVRKLEIGERFRLAGLGDTYESAYALMSAEAHNNISFLLQRHFGAPSEGRFDLANTMLMSDILLSASEKLLRHLNHGVAVLSEARRLFDPISASIIEFDKETVKAASVLNQNGG